MKKILFVCTGNTCRSPMAQALFNKLSQDEKFHASSCGIYADGTSPISENAKQALLDENIDFSHTSTPITEQLLYDADYIIGITEKHAKTLICMYPQFADKIFAMPTDISDPYGCGIDIYRQCKDQIKKDISILLKVLKGENND